MDGDSRRSAIISILRESRTPLSGTEISKKLGVSRQVIVQDIALLRVAHHDIISTNKGYQFLLEQETKIRYRRIFKVKHEKKEILDELQTIVDFGGQILDVVVEHSIYGKIIVELIIKSRMDAEQFVEQVNTNQIKPLNELTHGEHYHTVEGDSNEILDQIQEKLKQKGYLIR